MQAFSEIKLAIRRAVLVHLLSQFSPDQVADLGLIFNEVDEVGDLAGHGLLQGEDQALGQSLVPCGYADGIVEEIADD